MDPEKIKLQSINKMFEYEKMSRELDNIVDIEILKNISKLYYKLYLKQQEVISKL